MTRSIELKQQSMDSSLLSAGARARARVLALLHGALRESGLDQTSLAKRMGIRKSAVNSIYRGNGNVRIDTLAECLAALGFEPDFTVVKYGEIDAARDERRAPNHVCVTLSDRDRINDLQPDQVLAVYVTRAGSSRHDRHVDGQAEGSALKSETRVSHESARAYVSQLVSR